MEMEYWPNRRHIQMQIPSFGNWEIYNDHMIPKHHQVVAQNLNQHFMMEDFLNFGDDDDDYEQFKLPYHYPKKKMMLDLRERKKNRRVCDETLQKQKQVVEEGEKRKKRAPKAVDEDLYKIPPEFLNKQSKRKNRMTAGGFWKGCLGLKGCTS
ncbi:hypothetical protein ZOSMA_226G00080 [Zostera marina]|uniref:Uncharacterized protein n=1 Tax=Zostera marina TaxID=29655 RepID=A0A0K9PKX6_ZOSMR|nr:hypothetical protein ZOSMA_226G00080 [Zostera marina]